MKIILATRNTSKTEQIKALFAGSAFNPASLAETAVQGQALEDGVTFDENALKKARFVQEQMPGHWVLADDSGICLDALNDAPGVNSAYWAGPNATTNEITQYTLKKMEPHSNRIATFRASVAVLSPDGKEHIFWGVLYGKVLEEARVPAKADMPYSPIFVPGGHDRCLAEMSTEEENRISHHAQAVRTARSVIEKLL